jgi:serine/threonine-protein kinase
MPSDQPAEPAGKSGDSAGARPGLLTEQSLLYGLLALQIQYIDQRTFVAVIRAWIADRSRPIRDLLKERVGISESRLTLLDGFLKEYLREHGDDLEESLASVSTRGSVLPELEQVDDPDLRASLERIASTRCAWPPADEDHTETFAGGQTRSGTCRYRVVGDHKQGGLGAIYLAHDKELNRLVALKEIKPPYSDQPEYRARFVREAEITGRLQHPGVIPVYGLGAYDDGRPYYAMRFIPKGDLKGAVAQHHAERAARERSTGEITVAFRELLAQFVLVCKAIAYAHSRGVIHRDLKPANILVGGYGETFVVDWGLAKPLGRRGEPRDSAEDTLRPSAGADSAASQVGLAIGTPEYMSPEQANGDPEHHTTLTDIFCLGSTLYYILTGRAPFMGPEKLENAKRGEFTRPRKIQPGTPPALEAICLKAMARDSAERYPSALALADDINRWLADEPVSVYSDPVSKRLFRWVRRHKTTVAAAAVLVVAGVIGLVVDDIRVGREKVHTENALELAKKERAAAELARQQAEQNFSQARRAVDALYQEAASHLAFMAGAEKYRLRLADGFLKDYDRFLERSPRDPQVRADAAAAYREAANLGRLLGDVEKPLARYRRALELLDGLATEFGGESKYRLNRALAEVDLGEFFRMNGRFSDAEEQYRKGLDSAVVPDAKPAQKVLAARVRAMALLNLSVTQNEVGTHDKARQSCQEALDLLRPLTEATPSQPVDSYMVTSALITLGDANRDGGDPRAGERALDEAIRLARSKSDEQDPNYRHLLGSALINLARCFESDPSRRTQAVENFSTGTTLLAELVKQSPNVTTYRRDLATGYCGLGGLLQASGNHEQATKYCDSALQFTDLLLKDHDLPGLHSLMGRTLANVGRIARDQKRYSDARRLLGQAIDEYEKALRSLPGRRIDRAAVDSLKSERDAIPP